jgi:hypothetical protein
LPPPRIVETRDEDGDPVFACLIDLPGAPGITIAESPARGVAETAARKIADAAPPA